MARRKNRNNQAQAQAQAAVVNVDGVKVKTASEIVSEITAGSILKPLLFDLLLTVGMGGFSALSKYNMAKFAVAAIVYAARDIAGEVLPAGYKWLAIPFGFAVGSAKGMFNERYDDQFAEACAQSSYLSCKAIYDNGKFLISGANNAAYEASKVLFKGTFDDWFASPIIENLEHIMKESCKPFLNYAIPFDASKFAFLPECSVAIDVMGKDKLVKSIFSVSSAATFATVLYCAMHSRLSAKIKDQIEILPYVGG